MNSVVNTTQSVQTKEGEDKKSLYEIESGNITHNSISLFWLVTLAAPSPHMFRVSRRLNRMKHETGSLSTKPA
jgi:hypothetical protein